MQSSFDRVETIFIELIGFQFYRTRPEISKIVTVYTRQICLKGGGQAFLRVIISFGLGPPEVAPYMTGTFGEVFGPRNQTGLEPRPARK